jgi:hypothetical protein
MKNLASNPATGVAVFELINLGRDARVRNVGRQAIE